MNKLFYGLLLTLFSINSANAINGWIVPEKYKSLGGFLSNGDKFIISNENNDLIFILQKVHQRSQTNKDVWATKCSKSPTNGIIISRCVIQQPFQDKKIRILIDVESKIVSFGSADAEEISYRIDRKPIVHLKKYYIVNKQINSKIINELKNAERVVFSYKLKNQTYTSEKIDLKGFKENLEFAQQIIQEND